MRGPAPKPANERRRTNKPVGEWKIAPAGGWQHGKLPMAPDGSTADMKKVWKAWFTSWWAAFWELEDLPQLELALLTWAKAKADPAQVPRFTSLSKALGLMPKDRHDLRWREPDEEEEQAEPTASVRRLKVVDKGA